MPNETAGSGQRPDVSPQERATDLRARLDVLEASLALTQSAGLDLDAVLGQVCGRAAAALSAAGAAVYLRGDDGDLKLARLQYAKERVGEAQVQRLEELLGRGPGIVDDPTELRALGGPWSPGAGTGAVAVAALRLGERDLGALVVARAVGEDPWSEVRVELVLDAIAQQAALAISNAQLYARERSTVRQLQALDERKADYVAGLSHDLRSPLSGMLAFVQTMRRVDATASPEERLEYLDIMERQVTRLIGLVEDMLLGVRLEAGRLEPDLREPHDLTEVVEGIVGTLAPAHRDRIRLELRGPVVARVDRRQIERVVQNLVDNALVHTTTSTVVSVAVRSDAADGGAVLIVSDDGPGIERDALDALFTRYGRPADAPPGSTGLGLYTTRGIVEGHGGRIEADSAPGAGATFTVHLPDSNGA